MAGRIVALKEAIAAHVRDGDSLALEGFTHLIPHEAGHEIIRQRRRNLTLIRMTPDVIYDQLIGMGCAERLIFSWGGNPGVGSLHRFRDAIENGWPRSLAIEEYSHAAMAAAYAAGAANLPFATLRGFTGTDLPAHNRNVRTVTCPFTGEVLAAVPALRPDVAIIHAQQADRRGNVLIWGIVGVQKEAVLAARRAARGDRHGRRDRRRVAAAAAGGRAPQLGDRRGLPGTGRRAAFLRAGLLRARQRILWHVGRHRARTRRFQRLDEHERTGARCRRWRDGDAPWLTRLRSRTRN